MERSYYILPALVLLASMLGGLVALALGGHLAHADRVAVSSTGLIQSGSCNTASSTLLSLQPPSGATSTLQYLKISGLNGATSTDIIVATSSSPWIATSAQNATSTLNENIMGLAGVAATSRFESVAGLTIGPAQGYNSAAGGPYKTALMTEVGPTESVVVFSTSTNPLASAATKLNVPTSCTYEAIWVP